MEPSAASPAAVRSGVVRLEGRDALTVLHNISTAFLLDLPPLAARVTLFCDFRGRLLHRAVVARSDDDSVWLLRADGQGAELAAFVDRHVFREDVRLAPHDEFLRVREVVGGFGLEPARADWVHHAPARVQVASDFGFELESADAGGASIEPEAERIRAGRPRHGREVRDAFTPFEVGLAHEVHLDKGCFTGQEALMRLITYKSVRRSLARLEGRGAPPAIDAEVKRGDAAVGRTTSVAAAESGWIALATLKQEAFALGAELRIEGDTPASIDAIFPFEGTRPQGRP